MRDDSTLRREDKLLLACEKSITPYCSTSLLVSDIFLSCYLMHHLFEIESSSIEEEFHDSRRDSEMSRISPISFSTFILDIYDSEIPILFSFIVFVYSPLHTDKVVCIWFFSSRVYCSILCSRSEFLESCRHIRYP